MAIWGRLVWGGILRIILQGSCAVQRPLGGPRLPRPPRLPAKSPQESCKNPPGILQKSPQGSWGGAARGLGGRQQLFEKIGCLPSRRLFLWSCLGLPGTSYSYSYSCGVALAGPSWTPASDDTSYSYGYSYGAASASQDPS